MLKPTIFTDCWETIALERAFLIRLARLQLSSSADAEDVVQETLIGAANSWERFEGRSSIRTWLTGILRNKIIDVIRRRKLFQTVHWSVEPGDLSEFDYLFTADDAWHPEAFIDTVCGEKKAAENQLLDIVELCMNRLPADTARLFLMREYLGMELAEIMDTCTVSAGNLRVILYRARMRLRDCAVRGWGELDD
ncbi:sigma-70 family RNA polymerase sigma factor [Duganella sp. FT135W]|uniref:Sigma-70 family RNA polymerase sigma factor n=1 Tax=Duganella flavida TaxID=2692175 RepID=A0A6L8K9X2_9BURK|nr:sigma-70 family RNA polymerase sigma factor [Duganella flavida]MYM22624.1 sigma-70 family RNA polymerase sigma factor [Duganella flavida]